MNFRSAWLDSLAERAGLPRRARSLQSIVMTAPGAPHHLDAALDRLADEVEGALDWRRLEEIVWARKEHVPCLPI